ncbi:MAG: hypothetical protein JST62_03145 [Bacteroidetes bacterium]|jgi:hypothetical protein|nr:hypothetical protein [Bacteroidota bacterium]
MKKKFKIILILFLVFIISLFVFPRKVIYEGNVDGKVIDEKIGQMNLQIKK